MPLKSFVYRHRLVAKRAISVLVRILPKFLGRRLLALAERAAFSITPQYQGDTLPPIFHYWSARFLAPAAQRLGIGSPEAFFQKHIAQIASSKSDPVRVLSVGTGACSMEMALAEQLKASGLAAHVTCIDFNPSLMNQAAASARERHLDALMTFVARDCNLPFQLPPHDAIIVNQFFHHVTELEIFCRSLRDSLGTHGVLLTSDIIGRNGHMLWPDVETELQKLWATLPPEKRHDRHFGTADTNYRPIDHAAYSNEGVRAQDVVASLLAEFDFELFFSFGGAIAPFVERRVGFNFDPQLTDDQAFIDRVQAVDSDALEAGRYPAANMIAALRHKGGVSQPPVFEPISPERHAALSLEQLAKVPHGQR
jgi:SAM-dependent methyltransferase